MNTTKLKDRLNSKIQQPESTEERNTNMTTEATALAKIESGYIALRNNALEIISENLKNQQLSQAMFDVVKAPACGEIGRAHV